MTSGRIDTMQWDNAVSTRDAQGQSYPMLKVRTLSGDTYMIPEMWVIGFCRSGRTVKDAVTHWLEQVQLEEVVS